MENSFYGPAFHCSFEESTYLPSPDYYALHQRQAELCTIWGIYFGVVIQGISAILQNCRRNEKKHNIEN